MKTYAFRDFVRAHPSLVKEVWPLACGLLLGALLGALTRHIAIGVLTAGVAWWFFRNNLRDDRVGFFAVESSEEPTLRTGNEESAADAAGESLRKMHEVQTNPLHSYNPGNVHYDLDRRW